MDGKGNVRILFRKFQRIIESRSNEPGHIVRILFRKFQRETGYSMHPYHPGLESYLESFKEPYRPGVRVPYRS